MSIGIDGAGGFIDYNDSATAAVPLVLTDGVWVQLTNDGLGPFSNRKYAPYGVSDLMDTPSGLLNFSELEYGDAVWIRNDFEVTPSIDLATLDVRYVLGAGASQYTLPRAVGVLARGAGIPYRQAALTEFIYMGDRNTKQNPVGVEIRLTGADGTCVNNGAVIEVLRR